MVGAFFSLFILSFVIFGCVSLYRYRRDWLGVWRGKKVQVRKTLRSVQLLIDDQIVPINKISNSYEGVFENPPHGSISAHIALNIDSNGVVGNCQVVLDGEIIPLIEAPRNMWGESTPEVLPTLKERVIVEGTTISDPRFAAAERLYDAICTEAKEEPETIALLQELHQKLVDHMILSERLIQSKSDYIALGNDGGEMAVLEQDTQGRIQLMLASLQDLHLAIVQKNLSADQETLGNVRELLWKLKADTEAEEAPSAKRKKTRVQQQIKK